MSDVNHYVNNLCSKAKNASYVIAKANLTQKNQVLNNVINLINSKRRDIKNKSNRFTKCH